MRVSKLFTKTSKNVPADETARNAQLLIQAGFVYKEMAGVYAYTTLGLKVLDKIKQILREEMDAIDGQEIIMTSLQSPDVWKKTGRWSDDTVDIWFKTKLKDDSEVGLAWSHEEPIMAMMNRFINSYKDLPTSVYQFQTKLRNELRVKSGIMRGREFVMKDMYSLHASAEDLEQYYNKVTEAYKKIYNRLGIGEDTYVTFASGGAFTKFSHEFQTICDAGEDTLYVNREKNIAVNEEVLDDALKELGISRDDMEVVRSVEVGNIFNFGSEKSESMGIFYTDKDGTNKPIYLASYGIGITRVMGVIAEKFCDDKGLVWPEAVSPAKVYIVSIGGEEVVKKADALYDELTSKDIEVIYDDRDERPGTKFADAELIGIPYRVTVSDRLIAEDKYELTVRKNGETRLLTRDQLLDTLS